MRTVEFGCPTCGRAVEVEPGGAAVCRRCGNEAKLPAAADAIGACLVCECPELYRHRDFNQKLGILLIVVGVVLCLVLTSFWPLVIAAVVDLFLYFTLADVAICYRCKAHHRGFANVGAIPAFDLERHEHYRFKQARAEGKIPPRDAG